MTDHTSDYRECYQGRDEPDLGRPTLNEYLLDAQLYTQAEAEMVAHIVLRRNGVDAKPVNHEPAPENWSTNIDQADLYKVMRAAGHVESFLKLSSVPIRSSPPEGLFDSFIQQSAVR